MTWACDYVMLYFHKVLMEDWGDEAYEKHNGA